MARAKNQVVENKAVNEACPKPREREKKDGKMKVLTGKFLKISEIKNQLGSNHF